MLGFHDDNDEHDYDDGDDEQDDDDDDGDDDDGDDADDDYHRAEAVLSALVITYWANFVKEGWVLISTIF